HWCWAPASERTVWTRCCPIVNPMFRRCYTSARPAVRTKTWYKSPKAASDGRVPRPPAYPGRMARMTGSWLSGPAAALPKGQQQEQKYPGQLLGLPEHGPGSLVTTARRAFALI